jgi:hypothetical protein
MLPSREQTPPLRHRGWIVDEFGHLDVYRVALTSVAVPTEDGAANPTGQSALLSTLAVWADLTPLVDQGLEIGMSGDQALPGLRALDAFLLPDRARMGLVLTPLRDTDDSDDPYRADYVTDEDAGDDGGDGQPELTLAEVLDPHFPRFNIILPTTAVALAVAMSTVPAGFRISLINDVPPTDPEFAVLTPEDLAAFLLVDFRITDDALTDVVPPALQYPIPYPAPPRAHTATPQDSMQALLWSLFSGVALGQRHALQKAIDFGEWATALAAMDEPDHERITAILDNALSAQMLSMDAIAEEDVTVDPTHLPAPMSALNAHITGHLFQVALQPLADGTPFATVAAEHGLHNALPALAVLVAARAHVAVEEYADGTTTTWLIGLWLDGTTDQPVWTLPSCSILLARHDLDVPADLLISQGEDVHADEPSPLLNRYLHALVGALDELDLDPDLVEAGLRGLDVLPVNVEDVVELARSLRGTAQAIIDTPDTCRGCEATTPITRVWPMNRLARAAAALLPCLADLDAQEGGHEIGDQHWTAHRRTFLNHWLNTAADNAA